ncbi:MAG: hypothetical protein WC459_01040 [Patescibacteria group bacterium]
MKYIKSIFIFLIGLFYSLPAFAAYGLEETADSAGLKTGLASKSVPEIVGSIISIGLSLLGIIFLILMIYGGALWMTSYGNEQKVTKAKDLIISAVIGLIITLAAYAITNFVVGALVGSPTPTP